MSIIWCFDVDETLSISGGPIPIQTLRDLRKDGHCVGIVGNWGKFCATVNDWPDVVSFMSIVPPMQNQEGIFCQKDWFMNELRRYGGHGFDELVMVGNILGVSGLSDDKGAADRVGVRFISETDFANGAR